MVDHSEAQDERVVDERPPLPVPGSAQESGPKEGDDEALDRIWRGLEAQDPLAAVLAGGDEEEEPVAKTSAPKSSQEPAQGKEAALEDQPDDDAYRHAAAALRRDGWSTEDVALLPRERVVALGEKRSKVQADVDTAFAELTELRADRGAARENEARRGENEAEAAPAQVDVSKIADRLALDEEGAQELAEFIRGSQAPLLEQIQVLRQELPNAQRMAMQAAAETARRDLAERFPQVQDPSSDSYRRVLARMDRLQQSGSYSGVGELMEDAVLMEFRDDIAAQASAQSLELRKARANGQAVSTKGEPKERSKPLSQEDHELAVFQALMDESVPYEERRAAARKLDQARRH